ncbi:MAG: hypothetical protein U0M06_13830 [Clostridia bacterium]|nr:hypothetical protein [Clostridia bacterium]
MASEKWLTDEMVEEEISRLSQSPYVKLARAEQRIKYRRRQYLYQLRDLEKRGKKLESEGFNLGAEEEDYE